MSLKKKIKFKLNLTIVFFLILFIGGYSRIIEVLNHNYLFGFDQGLFYEAVRSIVVSHKLTLVGSEVGGIGGFFQGPGWYYLLSIPFKLANGDPYAGIVLMFILSMSAIALSYILLKNELGKQTALSVAFFVSIAIALSQQARSIWPPFVITPLAVIFFVFLYKFINGRKSYFPLAVFVIGIMSNFEIATSGTLLIQLIIFSILFFFPKKLLDLKTILYSILAFIITQTPLILFDIRHNFIGTHGIINLFTVQRSSQSIMFALTNHLEVFTSSILSVLPGNSYVGIIILCIVAAGSIIYICDKKIDFPKRFFVFYLLSFPIILFFAFMGTRLGMWQWWIFEIPVVVCFLCGIILYYFLSSSKLERKIIAVAIFSFLILSSIHYGLSQYKNDFNDYGGTAKVKGKIDAIDYIHKDSLGKPFGLLVFSPPIYTYPYDYLLWWYGQRKYGYIPHSEKKGTFYLLIEKDPAKPWSYKGWLETVIKSGTIIETVTLPSGFIVQKRVENE